MNIDVVVMPPLVENITVEVNAPDNVGGIDTDLRQKIGDTDTDYSLIYQISKL